MSDHVDSDRHARVFLNLDLSTTQTAGFSLYVPQSFLHVFFSRKAGLWRFCERIFDFDFLIFDF